MNTDFRNVKRLLGAFAATIGIFVSGAALADPIGGGGLPCGNNSCQGATYWLTYSGSALPDVDPVHETYRIFLSIDTSTYTGGGVAIAAAAIKVSSQVFAASLFSAPGGLGNWNLMPGGISNGGSGGCSGSGSGFECAGWAGSGVGIATGGFLQWVFDITVDNGDLFSGLDLSSIKVEYVNSDGDKVGALVSEELLLQTGRPPNETPEPQTLALLGLGLLGIALSRRRRMR